MNLIEARLEADSLYLRILHSRLDVNTSPHFKKECLESVPQTTKHVTIDAELLEFLDSTGISALLTLYKSLPQGEGHIRIIHLTPHVRSIIELLRLHRLFELEPAQPIA